jgi:phosphatidylserine/phosphatidylglycerophosphate/cardiolipin synthase-like enzyme
VHVEVILDRKQKSEQYSSADYLQHAGIPVLIDGEHAIAHNKIIIIDGRVVITGSFNFTKQAEQNNAENLLVIRDPTIANRYIANWQLHAEHSEIYIGKKE